VFFCFCFFFFLHVFFFFCLFFFFFFPPANLRSTQFRRRRAPFIKGTLSFKKSVRVYQTKARHYFWSNPCPSGTCSPSVLDRGFFCDNPESFHLSWQYILPPYPFSSLSNSWSGGFGLDVCYRTFSCSLFWIDGPREFAVGSIPPHFRLFFLLSSRHPGTTWL